MDTQDTRIWYNTKTGEVVDCKYHYDCAVIVSMINEQGKMNFFRDGWCRLGVYSQGERKIGIVEAYNKKNLKKAIEYLLSRSRINTMVTETHEGNEYEMKIFENPIFKENVDGI